MGSGSLERIYEKCLLIELRKAGLDTETQKPITVYMEREKPARLAWARDGGQVEIKRKVKACPGAMY